MFEHEGFIIEATTLRLGRVEQPTNKKQYRLIDCDVAGLSPLCREVCEVTNSHAGNPGDDAGCLNSEGLTK